MLSYFKYIPSCSSCEYANLYIPYFTYPYSDPYCCKGHGLCKVDKVCENYRLINSHFCYECSFMIVKDGKNYCSKKNLFLVKINDSCVYFKNKDSDLIE